MRVEVELGPITGHLTQVLAGLALLEASGEVRVRLRPLPAPRWRHEDPTLRIETEGGERVVLDLRDGTDLSAVDLDWCTAYRKRGYARAVHGGDDRIAPLGLNYPVSAGADWRWRQLGWALRRTPSTGWRRAVGAARVLAVGQPTVASFEHGASADEPARVLLATRVWDPRRVSGAKAAAWEAMNEVRAGTIRALASELGDRLVGGLAPTPWALERYPDLVLDARAVERSRYLAQVRSAAVCIATAGLRASNGWRLAEYLAATRAIVSEPLHHEVPGPLADGHGYLAFTDADGCVELVGQLLASPQRRRDLAEAGAAYYRGYVRPDALVRRALGLVAPAGA